MSLLQMSAAGAVLAGVIVVLRAALLCRLPKRTFVALWWVALLRLLVPVAIPSRFSAYALLGRLGQKTAAGEAALPAVPADTAWMGTEALPGSPLPAAVLNGAEAVPTVQGAAAGVSPWAVLWALGAAVCALAFAGAYWHCRREFAAALPVQSPFVESWKRTHPLRRDLDIRQTDRIDTPLTYGVLRPVILLPKNTDWNDTERLDFVLLHEYIHIRRWDAAAKLAAAAALCLHWFNPMVWVLYVLFSRDLELACDEGVLRGQDGTRRAEYARTLIDLEERKSGLMPLCSGFGKNANEERIVAIMKIRKGTVLTSIAACVLVAAVAGVFATSPRKEADTALAPSESAVSQALEQAHAAAAARAERAASSVGPAPALPAATELERAMEEQLIEFEYGENQSAILVEAYFKMQIPVEYIDEWWTYEEYCAFVEDLREDLEGRIGTVGYREPWEVDPRLAEGEPEEFVWTQELVDETMRLYELKLQAMEEGYLLAKSACGNQIFIPYTEEERNQPWQYSRTMVFSLPDGTEGRVGPYYCLMDQPQVIQEMHTVRADKWQQLLEPYEPYGVTSVTTNDGALTRMYCYGKEVRCIYDATQIIGERDSFPMGYPADAIDLCAVYENGELTGLRVATAEEMKTWTSIRRAIRSEATNGEDPSDGPEAPNTV